jgi:hypothetical protein
VVLSPAKPRSRWTNQRGIEAAFLALWGESLYMALVGAQPVVTSAVNQTKRRPTSLLGLTTSDTAANAK